MKFSAMFRGLCRKVNKNEVAAVRISLLIAALDGDVSKEEILKFRDFVHSCDGYTADEIESTCASTLRAAGYLMLLARVADKDAVIDVFVSEANRILPTIFDMGPEAVRDAVAIWKMMAEADGSFSEVERAAIQRLEDFLTARSEALGLASVNTFAIR